MNRVISHDSDHEQGHQSWLISWTGSSVMTQIMNRVISHDSDHEQGHQSWLRSWRMCRTWGKDLGCEEGKLGLVAWDIQGSAGPGNDWLRRQVAEKARRVTRGCESDNSQKEVKSYVSGMQRAGATVLAPKKNSGSIKRENLNPESGKLSSVGLPSAREKIWKQSWGCFQQNREDTFLHDYVQKWDCSRQHSQTRGGIFYVQKWRRSSFQELKLSQICWGLWNGLYQPRFDKRPACCLTVTSYRA